MTYSECRERNFRNLTNAKAAALRGPVNFAVVDTRVRKTGWFLSQLPYLLTKQAEIVLRFAPTFVTRSAPTLEDVPQGFVGSGD